jgi:Fur family ferric uptake transcriptional regulator
VRLACVRTTITTKEPLSKGERQAVCEKTAMFLRMGYNGEEMNRARIQPPLPKNYRLLWEVVTKSGPGAHVTTGEVFLEARRLRPSIGLSTVYRGLARLTRLGLVNEVAVPGCDSVAYEVAAAPHAHFLCRLCGRIDDVPYVLPRDVIDRLETLGGYLVEGDNLTLTGRCSSCRANSTEPSSASLA